MKLMKLISVFFLEDCFLLKNEKRREQKFEIKLHDCICASNEALALIHFKINPK